MQRIGGRCKPIAGLFEEHSGAGSENPGLFVSREKAVTGMPLNISSGPFSMDNKGGTAGSLSPRTYWGRGFYIF